MRSVQYHIPSSEMVYRFVRSSGAGGQNVNKVATKVQLWWHVGASVIFSPEEKQRIRTVLARYLTDNDEILLSFDAEREQSRNKALVIEKLHRLVFSAVRPKKKRISTRPTRASKERRIEEKKMVGRKKSERKRINVA